MTIVKLQVPEKTISLPFDSVADLYPDGQVVISHIVDDTYWYVSWSYEELDEDIWTSTMFMNGG